MMSYTNSTTCRSCHSTNLITIYASESNVPLAGCFLQCPSHDTPTFPLTIQYCTQCSLIQCREIVDASVLFTDSYFYRSSSIPYLCRHFETLCEYMTTRWNHVKVLEMGCNDGVLLDRLHNRGFQTIGIDPIGHIQHGKYPVYKCFFNMESVQQIVVEQGLVDIFVSCNSFAHIDNMNEIAYAMRHVLRHNGVAIIEVHYSRAIVDECQFDFLYHEHMSYYTATSIHYFVTHVLKMCLHDIEIIPVHGTSMRVIIHNHQPDTTHLTCSNMLDAERSMQIDGFAMKVNTWKHDMAALLDTLPIGTRFCGYGASGRTNMLCNAFKFPLPYIVDDAPTKVGHFMPITNTPILSSAHLYVDKPDFIIILAWPYATDIMKTHPSFNYIVPLPEPRIIQRMVQ